MRLYVTGGGSSAFLENLKLPRNYEPIIKVIDGICAETVKSNTAYGSVEEF